MSRWVAKAQTQAFSLMVSVPRNRADMAAAAESGGADAIKVHLNVKHPASGHVFGNLSKERNNIFSVVKSVSVPVGAVPGAESACTVEELMELKSLGIDFFDIFAHHMPLAYMKAGMGKMVCVDGSYTPDEVRRLEKIAEVFECSIIPHEGYGKFVAVSDLIAWQELTENLSVPLLVSTQRKIKPEECGELQRAGVRGIVIGVVVTGSTAKGVYETTRRFRQAIDRLKS